MDTEHEAATDAPLSGAMIQSSLLSFSHLQVLHSEFLCTDVCDIQMNRAYGNKTALSGESGAPHLGNHACYSLLM